MDELYMENPATEETVDIPEMEIQETPEVSELPDSNQIFLNHEGVLESKPKVNIKMIAIISATVVALIAAICLLWKPVAKLLGLSSLSPRDQFISVETQYANDCADAISAVYGDLMVCLEEGLVAGESEIKLRLGDQVVDLLSTQMGIDASWLDGVAIRMHTASDLRYMQVSMIPVVGEVELFTLDIIYDSQEQKILAGVPEMNSTYLFNVENVDSVPTTPMDQEMIDAFLKAMPTEQAVNALLRKYFQTALSAIKTVIRETEKVTIEGITQECTVLQTQLDAVTYMDMAIAVLKEAKQGADLYSMVTQISDLVAPGDHIPDKSEWGAEIDKLITALEDEKSKVDTESVVTWKIYLDNKDRLIGFASEVSDTGDSARIVTVRNGKKFASEVNVGNMLVLAASGTKDNNKINGKFKLLVSGMEMATFEIIDFDSKKLDQNELSGTVRVKVSKLISELVFATSTGIDLTTDIVFSDEYADGGLGVYVYMADQMVGGIGMKVEQIEDYTIEIPSKFADANNEDAMENWLSDVDFEKITENMNKAGIPEEVIAALFMSMLNLENI